MTGSKQGTAAQHKVYKYPCRDAPASIAKVTGELGGMEPPVFSDQSKPRGRKRTTKKGPTENHWDETWVSDWDWYHWQSWDDWEPPTKKPKKNPKQRMAGYVESGASESNKPEPTTKKHPKESKPASKKVEKTSGANKGKGKGKAGLEEKTGEGERRLFDPVQFAFDHEKSREELLEKGYWKPPSWVEPGNVYSNQYRRSKAMQENPNLDQVREAAKAATKVFRQHGLCHPELLDSFAAEKRVKKEKGPGK
eukprot:s649_g10.t1